MHPPVRRQTVLRLPEPFGLPWALHMSDAASGCIPFHADRFKNRLFLNFEMAGISRLAAELCPSGVGQRRQNVRETSAISKLRNSTIFSQVCKERNASGHSIPFSLPAGEAQDSEAGRCGKA